MKTCLKISVFIDKFSVSTCPFEHCYIPDRTWPLSSIMGNESRFLINSNTTPSEYERVYIEQYLGKFNELQITRHVWIRLKPIQKEIYNIWESLALKTWFQSQQISFGISMKETVHLGVIFCFYTAITPLARSGQIRDFCKDLHMDPVIIGLFYELKNSGLNRI